MKKYIKYALVFLALGIACGVFYREFSKPYGLANQYTVLGLAHTHFLVLGVAFVLLIGLVTDKLNKHGDKLFRIGFCTYSVGVLGAGIMILVRGILDVLVKSPNVVYSLSSGANGALSGVAGIFHAVLGIGIVLVFVAWLKKEKSAAQPVGGSGE